MAGISEISPRNTVSETRISPGALRMHASRQRKRAGLRCITVDLREKEIDRLTELGYLRDANRNDNNQVLAALYRFLDKGALGGAHL
jgi:hypothetical protein